MFALGEFSFGPDIARDSSGVRPGRYGAVVHGLEERVALRLALRARSARDSYLLATPSEYRVGPVGSAVGSVHAIARALWLLLSRPSFFA